MLIIMCLRTSFIIRKPFTPPGFHGLSQVRVSAQAGIRTNRFQRGLPGDRDQAGIANQIRNSEIGQHATLPRPQELAWATDAQVGIRDGKTIRGIQHGAHTRLGHLAPTPRDQ